MAGRYPSVPWVPLFRVVRRTDHCFGFPSFSSEPAHLDAWNGLQTHRDQMEKNINDISGNATCILETTNS